MSQVYVALFKIKNESFDKNRFGLSDNEFLLDVISGFSFSKNIKDVYKRQVENRT